MCLSTLKLKSADGEKTLAEYVSEISINGDLLSYTDIMGDSGTVSGKIQSIDLMNNIIIVE